MLRDTDGEEVTVRTKKTPAPRRAGNAKTMGVTAAGIVAKMRLLRAADGAAYDAIVVLMDRMILRAENNPRRRSGRVER